MRFLGAKLVKTAHATMLVVSSVTENKQDWIIFDLY